MAQGRASSTRSRRSAGGAKRKTGTSKRRSGSSNSRARSSTSRARSSTSRSASRSTSKPRASSRKASGAGRRTSASGTRKKAGASRSNKTAATQNGRSTVLKVAEKAKGPALAGGAALLGLAGGVALNGKKRKGPIANARSKLKMPQPNLAKRLSKIDTSSLSFGNAATGVARGSSKVGEVASQVQKAAELISPDAAADEKKRRR